MRFVRNLDVSAECIHEFSDACDFGQLRIAGSKPFGLRTVEGHTRLEQLEDAEQVQLKLRSVRGIKVPIDRRVVGVVLGTSDGFAFPINAIYQSRFAGGFVTLDASFLEARRNACSRVRWRGSQLLKARRKLRRGIGCRVGYAPEPRTFAFRKLKTLGGVGASLRRRRCGTSISLHIDVGRHLNLRTRSPSSTTTDHPVSLDESFSCGKSLHPL